MEQNKKELLFEQINKILEVIHETEGLEIDVVPTWEYRTYIGENNDPYNFYRGVKLWSDDGEEVINYPKT